VEGSATACTDSVPAGVERKLENTAKIVARALGQRGAARRRLLVVARRLLVQLGHRVDHARGLSPDCVLQLQTGIAQATAYVDSLPGGPPKRH
jgi:hypothetical protein